MSCNCDIGKIYKVIKENKSEIGANLSDIAKKINSE